MDRIDEFNKKLAQLDRSDPTQVQAMIDLIDKWLQDGPGSIECKAQITSIRTHLWLDMWSLSQDILSFDRAYRHLNTSLEGKILYDKDISAIGRVFTIFMEAYWVSKTEKFLKLAISWGLSYYIYAKQHLADYAANINNLAVLLEECYTMSGAVQYLNKSIQLHQELLDGAPQNSAVYQYNLANVLRKRYSLSKKVEDLDYCIQLYEEAMEKTSQETDDLLAIVQNLTNSLRERYDDFGNIRDLERRIELCEKLLVADSEDPSYRPSLLNNLALALEDRYSINGILQDLYLSIQLHQDALDGTSEDSIDFPKWLNNLANALMKLYWFTGNTYNLEKSVQLYRETLPKVKSDSTDKPGFLNNLSIALRERFNQSGYFPDLEESIELGEEAVASSTSDSNVLLLLFSNLANALEERFCLTRNVHDLERGIRLHEKALEGIPEDSTAKSGLLDNLANAIGERYEYFRNGEDLDRCLRLREKALQRTHPSSINYPLRLNNLATALRLRYIHAGNIGDAVIAIFHLHSANKALQQGHHYKPRIQGNLGNLSILLRDYWSALEAYEEMAKNLEILRSASPYKRDREKMLSDYSRGFANLVFCCLKLNQPEKALRYAEAAKSRALVDALHNQVTDISNLATQDETLKANLEELQKLQHEINWLLRQLGADDENISWIDPNTSRFRRPLDEINADLKDKRAKEQELWEILEKHAPVFAMTVSAPPFFVNDAFALADEENAALISYYQHSQGWIAFIVSKREFFIAELQGVEDLLETYQSAFSNLHSPFGKILLSCVLEEAWQVLIQPLQPWLPLQGSNLIIAPFAGLHHLPFAAFTNPEDGSCLVDHYCLKIITSLGTLRAMRNQAQIQAEVRTKNQEMTVVGYASIPSSPSYLPAVEDEVNAISRLFSLPHPLIGGDARINDVLTQAPGSHVLHFACHGMFDPKQPHHSGLMLEDGWLTVRDILTRMNLSGTDMVVMSSCLSGLSRISQGEELTGLLTAFISARAKSVVGSLWSVDDRSTAELMVRFYELISKGWERSAALREAQLFIRKQPQWQHPYYWSPFFLTGVG